MLTLFSLRTAKLLYKCHCVYIHTYTLSTYHHNRPQRSSSSLPSFEIGKRQG
ncbi:hypothetical protein SORBI_3005G129748 [Sorghum bicolor]|uniref:Uncharacterized protein n=1 Tax=Sorghum bicolor TaxID=4558 RepID=A0A1Z5RIE9_SORBI|nr:hypothetical protein SORBI_3005G129748 [Sorghum bicolor]